MARRAIQVLAALAVLATTVAAQPGEVTREPVAEHWVSVRLAGGDGAPGSLAAGDGAPASLEARGYRQLPVPEGMAPEAYRAWIEEQPGVLSAVADAPVRATAGPNDLFYRGVQSPYLEPVGAPAGWDITTNAETIVVAVLDTGIDLSHEDLAPNLWQNLNDADNDGVDDDNNGCIDDRYGCRFINLTPKRTRECGYDSSTPTGDVWDDHGSPDEPDGLPYYGSHGTAVAGIIGARGNNSVGIAGVAWRVRLMTLKVLDCGPGRDDPGGEMSNVARAIDYARRMGADVINLSLASEPGNPAADIPVLREAIEEALAEGIIIVAAAGNHDARGVGFPAAYAQYANVIGVGASDASSENAWAPYSSYGGGVDVAAPGGLLTGNRLASTVRSDLLPLPYGTFQPATSFATPVVTGLFALVMARNPDLTMEEYIAIVQDSATAPTPADHGGNWAGSGVIDIRAALERVPMTVSGAVLEDWTRARAGTPVRALIDGVECGTTETETSNGFTRYSLRVATEHEVAGCGALGREVEFLLGDRTAAAPLPWSARNETLVIEKHDLNAVEPPPGATVVQELGEGWSQAAYLGPTMPLPQAASILPESLSVIAVWDADAEGGGVMLLYYPDAPDYAQTLPELSQYEAFWMYSEGGSIATPNPQPPAGRELALVEGWNAFVYTGQARSVEEALASVDGLYDQVLHYDNLASDWTSYLPGSPPQLNDYGGLHPFRVYWIRMTAPGALVME